MAGNYNNTSQRERGGNQIDFLENLRKQKKRRKLRRNLILLALLGLSIAYFSGVFSAMFASGKMLVESAQVSLLPAGEYPSQTGLSDIYQIEELEGGFVALGEESAVVYAASGTRLRTLQYGFTRPAISVGEDRFLMYQRSGTSLKIETRLNTLAEKEFTNPILLAEMSNSGNFAVATEDDHYIASVKVYNARMSEILSFSMTSNEGAPTRMAFSTNSETLAIATLSAENGLPISKIYLISPKFENNVMLDSQVDSILQEIIWLSSSEILAIYDTHAAIYDTKQEEAYLSAKYLDFNGQNFLGFSKFDKTFAFLLGNSEEKSYYITNNELTVLHESVQNDALDITLTTDALLITKQDEIVCIELDTYQEQTISMDEVVIKLLQAQELLVFTKNKVDVFDVPQFSEQ